MRLCVITDITSAIESSGEQTTTTLVINRSTVTRGSLLPCAAKP